MIVASKAREMTEKAKEESFESLEARVKSNYDGILDRFDREIKLCAKKSLFGWAIEYDKPVVKWDFIEYLEKIGYKLQYSDNYDGTYRVYNVSW